MEKILTVAELKARAPRLAVGQVNEALRPIGVRIGKNGDEWFADFCRDHPAFEAGKTGTRSFTGDKAGAIDDALHHASWYRRYAAFVSDAKADIAEGEDEAWFAFYPFSRPGDAAYGWGTRAEAERYQAFENRGRSPDEEEWYLMDRVDSEGARDLDGFTIGDFFAGNPEIAA